MDFCATQNWRVRIRPVDDAPLLFSPEHPWVLPLQLPIGPSMSSGGDTDIPVCCFELVDPDQTAFDGLNAKLAFDPSVLLGGENILPRWNATKNGFNWNEQQDAGFPLQATVSVRDGEVFLPNVNEYAADVTAHNKDVAANLGRIGDRGDPALQEDSTVRSKAVSVLGFPSLLTKALNNLVYRPKKGAGNLGTSRGIGVSSKADDVICIKLEDFYDPGENKFVYNINRRYTGYNKNGLRYDSLENEQPRISVNCWHIEFTALGKYNTGSSVGGGSITGDPLEGSNPLGLTYGQAPFQIRTPVESNGGDPVDVHIYSAFLRDPTIGGWFGQSESFRLDRQSSQFGTDNLEFVSKVEFYSEKQAEIVIRGCASHNIRGNFDSKLTKMCDNGLNAKGECFKSSPVGISRNRIQGKYVDPLTGGYSSTTTANNWYLRGPVWRINECLSSLVYIPKAVEDPKSASVRVEEEATGLSGESPKTPNEIGGGGTSPATDVVTISVVDMNGVLSQKRIKVKIIFHADNFEEMGPILFANRVSNDQSRFPITLQYPHHIDLIRFRKVKVQVDLQRDRSFDDIFQGLMTSSSSSELRRNFDDDKVGTPDTIVKVTKQPQHYRPIQQIFIERESETNVLPKSESDLPINVEELNGIYIF